MFLAGLFFLKFHLIVNNLFYTPEQKSNHPFGAQHFCGQQGATRELLFAGGQRAPPVGRLEDGTASGPLDCLLHSGLSQAGTYSRLSTELSKPSCSKQGPCNDLAGLRPQHFDTGSVTLSGKSSESWSVRFRGRAVSGAGL